MMHRPRTGGRAARGTRFLRIAAVLFVGAATLELRGVEAAQPQVERLGSFDYFVSGSPAAARAAKTQFLLALMGGGGSVDAAFTAIANSAGRGHIVVLRAVSDDSFDPEDGNYGEQFVDKWGPAVAAQTLVFHNRDASSDPRVLAVLHEADGIFIAGGDQANYIRYWKGTPVEDALNAHVRANRPIGGSSAGLAILGRYSYTALDGGSMESKVALNDPYDPGVTLESNFLHFKWLDQVITDTHFSARCRLGRLIVFVNRINERPPGGVAGIGIDERTALLIGPDGIGHLAAGSAGSAWLVMPPQGAVTLTKGQPLSVRDLRILRVRGGGAIDLRTRTVTGEFEQTVDSIERGHAAGASFATSILLRDTVPPGED